MVLFSSLSRNREYAQLENNQRQFLDTNKLLLILSIIKVCKYPGHNKDLLLLSLHFSVYIIYLITMLCVRNEYSWFVPYPAPLANGE